MVRECLAGGARTGPRVREGGGLIIPMAILEIQIAFFSSVSMFFLFSFSFSQLKKGSSGHVSDLLMLTFEGIHHRCRLLRVISSTGRDVYHGHKSAI